MTKVSSHSCRLCFLYLCVHAEDWNGHISLVEIGFTALAFYYLCPPTLPASTTTTLIIMRHKKSAEKRIGGRKRGISNGKLVEGEIGRDNCFGSYNGTMEDCPVSCVVSQSPTALIFLRVQFSETHFSFLSPSVILQCVINGLDWKHFLVLFVRITDSS